MALSTEQFVGRLIEAAPEVQPLVTEHVADFDEILLHLLVARVRDVAVEAFDRGDRDLAARIVDVFDMGLRQGDELVQNAVALSFVENVESYWVEGEDTPRWDPPARQEFIASWPQALRDEHERQRNWWEANRAP